MGVTLNADPTTRRKYAEVEIVRLDTCCAGWRFARGIS
jgi:hypothetical protein